MYVHANNVLSILAEKTDHPVQFKDLDPDLSSQFVFSPPLLRSRRKNVASISRIVKEEVSKNSSCPIFLILILYHFLR